MIPIVLLASFGDKQWNRSLRTHHKSLFFFPSTVLFHSKKKIVSLEISTGSEFLRQKKMKIFDFLFYKSSLHLNLIFVQKNFSGHDMLFAHGS